MEHKRPPVFETFLLVTICMVSCASGSNDSSTANPKKIKVNPIHGLPNATFLPALEMYLYSGPDSNNDYYYDTTVRPNLFSTLNISVQFYLLGIGAVDEKKGFIGPAGILILRWTDSRLTWNPEEFGGISTAIFDGYKIWLPRFFHNGHFFLATNDALLEAKVYHDGGVTAFLSVNEETPCSFDMTDFPRDTQYCHIHLMVSDPLIKLYASNAGDIGDKARSDQSTSLLHNKAWEIKNVSIMTAVELATETLDLLTITITMKRHASFFLRIYVTPVCFLLLLIPLIFLLPPDSSEKLTFGAVLLFCMIYVSQTVEAIYPPYTDTMPYLIRLTTASGALLFLCILLTSLISSVERIGRKKAVPAWMKKYIIGVIGKYLLVKENDGDGASHGTVHITPSGADDKTFIVQSEQSVDLTANHSVTRGAGSAEANQNTDVNQTLQSLVNELKYSRLQNKAHDDWTSLFTIINRILFFLTLFIGIVIILCFA